MKIELSHDLLAKKIHEKASQEDKMLLRIRSFIQDRFKYFNERKALLSWKDLNYISPHLEKLNLEPHEVRFIKLSKDKFWIIAFSTIFLSLAAIGIVFYFRDKAHKRELADQERMAAQLTRFEKVNQHAEELSEALTASREGLNATKEELRLALLALQERNDTLVNSYATYKVQQDYTEEKLKTELKVAQSAKLSELAASLLNVDKGYSFRLASQAWALNPENRQTMQTLYRLGGMNAPKVPSKQQTRNIIQKYKGTWGKLSNKEMAAIFHPENKVTAKEDIVEQVQQTIKRPTPPPPTTSIMQLKLQEMDKKIQIQRNEIKQSMQEINMQQQRTRKRNNNRPR